MYYNTIYWVLIFSAYNSHSYKTYFYLCRQFLLLQEGGFIILSIYLYLYHIPKFGAGVHQHPRKKEKKGRKKKENKFSFMFFRPTTHYQTKFRVRCPS